MFSPNENLSGYFTDLGQNLEREVQNALVNTLRCLQDYVTCMILPEIVSPDAEGDKKINMDMPFTLADFGSEVYAFADFYAVDYVRFGDIGEDDWLGAGQILQNPSNRLKFKEFYNLNADSHVSILRFEPKSFFIGQIRPDGIDEILPPIALKMH